MATAGRRVSESESSSDDSLLTDTSQLSLNLTCMSHPLHRRHSEEKWINRHRNTLGVAIADRHSTVTQSMNDTWFVTFHFVHTSFLMFHKHVHHA